MIIFVKAVTIFFFFIFQFNNMRDPAESDTCVQQQRNVVVRRTYGYYSQQQQNYLIDLTHALCGMEIVDSKSKT